MYYYQHYKGKERVPHSQEQDVVYSEWPGAGLLREQLLL